MSVCLASDWLTEPARGPAGPRPSRPVASGLSGCEDVRRGNSLLGSPAMQGKCKNESESRNKVLSTK